MATGSLQLMRITGYTDEGFNDAFEGDPYTVMINPETIKRNKAIEYNEQQAQDTSGPSQKYKSTPADKLNFDIVIDCTGIVDAKRTNMDTEMKALERIIYLYNGKIHRPNFVKIQWGSNFTFKGVLSSLDVSYTLFRPDGSPLRAKLTMEFSSYVSSEQANIEEQDESPDVTHLVPVVEGLTLPQLCQQVWNNDMYYVQVARFNNLNKFRNLKGIDKLIFPPIIQPV